MGFQGSCPRQRDRLWEGQRLAASLSSLNWGLRSSLSQKERVLYLVKS
jgi:hypothetical protein